jgi:hypothetical protein
VSAITQLAAKRINTNVAGVTGPPALPENEPGAALVKSATEYTEDLPTEFGGLTHLFGGQAAPSAQYEPVQTAKTIPAGSVRGPLGGLKPDFTNAAQKIQQAVKPAANPAPAQVPAVSSVAKNAVARARKVLKI